MSRIRFQSKMIRYEVIEKRPIVYLDESGFTLDSPRTHGYSAQGKRCFGTRDWQARGRLNAIGAIVNFQFIAITLFDSYIDSDVFYAWLIEDLLPKTPQNSVIVMDNASFHKRNDMIQAIEKAGHTPEFLPPYCPDLNPIEKKWAQAKAIRRKLRCDPYQVFLSPEL